MKVIFTLVAMLYAGGLDINPQWVKKIENCTTKNPTKMVYLFKQWHLDSNDNTKVDHKAIRQSENQIAIYDQIRSWIDTKKLDTVLAEGCSGEITKDFSKKFNGWTMSDLISKKADPDYEKILTHIPMKIEAKYGDRVHTLCADDEKVIKEQLLAMSDIRGDMGYLTHILEAKNNPAQLKTWIDSAKEVLKIPKDQTTDQVTAILKKDIDQKLSDIKEGISRRNKTIVANIKKISDKNMALVIGGLHAAELKTMFEKENIGCEIIEPSGYKEE